MPSIIAEETTIPTFTIDDCNCGIEGLYLTTEKLGSEYSLSCRFKPVDDKDSLFTYIQMSAGSYWDDTEATIESFELAVDREYNKEKTSAEKNNRVIIDDFLDDTKYSIIYRQTESYNKSSTFDGKEYFTYTIERRVIYSYNTIIHISGIWPIVGENPSDSEMIAIVNTLEECAKSAIDSQDLTSNEVTGQLTFEGKPLKYMPIYTKDDEDEKTFTDEGGQFSLNVADPDDYEFIIDFQYEKDGFTYFRLLSAKENEPYRFFFTVKNGKITKITIETGGENYQKQGLNYDINQEIKLEQLLKNELGETLHIINYVHLTEVLEYYTQVLDVNLKGSTLDVDLGRGPDAGYTYAYKNDRDYIWMEKELMVYENEYRPFVIYHEFTHYVHHTLIGETFENYVGLSNINHGGYANPTTGDSFSEGLAAFMPVIIANHYDRWWDDEVNKSVSLYPLCGCIDTNWKAWEKSGQAEEIAIAGILWDLVDGKDEMQLATNALNKLMEYTNYKLNLEKHDFDSDGNLNKQEFFHMLIYDEVNTNGDDYYDAEGIKEIAENFAINENVDSVTQKLLNYSKEKEGCLSQKEFYTFITENFDFIEDVAREKIGEEYEEWPDLTTRDMLRAHLSEEIGLREDDIVDLTFQELWNILKKPHEDFTSVYEDIINTFPSMKDGIDNIFINHGFFIESSQGNGEWNKWEPYQDKDKSRNWTNTEGAVELYADLGEMHYDVGEKIGTASNAGRETRRSFEPFYGEYVKVNEEIPFYEIEYVICDYEYYGLKLPSRFYKIRASNQDGLIYVPMPEDSEVTIRAEGVETKNPLNFNSDEFEERYDEAIENGYFMEHEFEITGEIPDFPVYLFDTTSTSSSSSDSQTPGFEMILIILGILILLYNKKKRVC